MPVFHTKTIESILDPVAQQVSIVLGRGPLLWVLGQRAKLTFQANLSFA